MDSPYSCDSSHDLHELRRALQKNLERVFSDAEAEGAILFFDEADALFGKRTELHDAHDRYANLETAFLLQRLESHNGVVILATNLQTNFDVAFLA